MDGVTRLHEEKAKRLLQGGKHPFLAYLTITIKSIFDVLAPADKQIFVSLEAQNNLYHTDPLLVPTESNDQFAFHKTLSFHAVFAYTADGELQKGTMENGTPGNFEKCLAIFATREYGVEGRVRDQGIVDLADFLFAEHSITSTNLHMKLGGSLEIVVECRLEDWKNRGIENLTVKKANSSKADEEEEQQTVDAIWEEEYRQLYKTYTDAGEWTEFARVRHLQHPRKIKFWKLDGPEECHSKWESELEAVCEERYRVPRRRNLGDYGLGNMAEVGKMSCLQKYRAVALEAAKPSGELRCVDSLSWCESGEDVFCKTVLHVDEGGMSDCLNQEERGVEDGAV